LFLWDRLGCGLGWDLGPSFHSGMGWVGLGWVGHLVGWVGLGWVEQIGPTDNSGPKCTNFGLELET